MRFMFERVEGENYRVYDKYQGVSSTNNDMPIAEVWDSELADVIVKHLNNEVYKTYRRSNEY